VAWLRLAELYPELDESPAGIRAAIEAVRYYLQSNPTDVDGWKRLVDLCRSAEDYLGEIHARVELADVSGAAFSHTRNAVNRFNQFLRESRLDLDSDEKRILGQRLRNMMVRRIDEASATDCSRLA
jgi:hypothetical protein